MASTSHSSFGANTEAIDVARTFPEAIRGKTILVTGVNKGGLGFAIVEALASQSPTNVILAGRTPDKLNECISILQESYAQVKFRALKLDLSNQQAVRTAADELLSWDEISTIDIVVNNAGIMNLPTRELTAEGIEMTFATNHIGHFLFTCLIMPKIIAAAKRNPKGTTRIINATSALSPGAHIRWSDLTFEKLSRELPEAERPDPETHRGWGVTDVDNKSYIPLQAYIQSKTANVLFSIALNQHLYAKHGILSFAAHPGVIRTELGRSYPPELMKALEAMFDRGVFPLKTLGAGAATAVTAASDPNLGLPSPPTNHGVYFADCQISDKTAPGAVSSSEAEKLWRLSEDLVKQKFSW